MGGLVGHVLSGLGFFGIGLWHLFNHIKLHSLNPNSYTSSLWFPTSKLRYIELILIIVGSSIFISMELFISPKRHNPLDVDGSISSNHLRHFEHSSISMSFITYAAFAILLDKKIIFSPKAKYGLTLFLGSLAFAQQLLLFRFHSTDHAGVEGQYHLLLQIVVFVSLATTLLGIGLPKSFMVSFVRSLSIVYQGVWLIVMGYMLWTPELIPKGCFFHSDDHGRLVVRCSSDDALHRAKSLATILFSWTLIAVTALAMAFYLVIAKMYEEKIEYSTLTKEDDNDHDVDVESHKHSKH